MPEKKTIKKAQKDKREGKSPSTQAGEFVHEEIEEIREGKHGAKNTKQAIAIGLSKARRAGVDIPDKSGKKSTSSHRIAEPKTSRKRSEAAKKRLEGEPTNVVSHKALSQQAKKTSSLRTSADRHRSALKAVKTKGKAGLKAAARKAAHTREEHKKAA